jgi:GDPmannose 4,6-dehydratase
MFGSNYSLNNDQKYQDENTPFNPQSPYGVSKLASHNMINIYRKAYNMFCCSGILFNHESPRRGENFVTRKITKFIGQLVNNKISSDSKLGLGNLEAERDWGHARDYVEAMYLMTQNESARDYVISSGRTYSVKYFCELAFNTVGLDYKKYVYIDPEFYRPAEVDYLRGNSSLAAKELDWTPKILFTELVKEMVHSDIIRYK